MSVAPTKSIMGCSPWVIFVLCIGWAAAYAAHADQGARVVAQELDAVASDAICQDRKSVV